LIGILTQALWLHILQPSLFCNLEKPFSLPVYVEGMAQELVIATPTVVMLPCPLQDEDVLQFLISQQLNVILIASLVKP
jgi:hypothetical protein